MATPQSEYEAFDVSDASGARVETIANAKSAESLAELSRDDEITRILGLSVPVSVILAGRDMTVLSILNLKCGSILEFEKSCEDELELNVADRTIGHGQAVKVGENFGLRVTDIGTIRERIDAMRG